MEKVLKFIKSRTVSFWLLSVAFVLTLVAMIMALVSCSAPNGAYKILGQEALIALSVIALAVIGATIAVSILKGDKLWAGILLLVSTLLLGFCVYILFNGKIDLMGTVWFSNLDQGNPVAESALSNGVVGIALYFVAGLAVSIAGCFGLAKDK